VDNELMDRRLSNCTYDIFLLSKVIEFEFPCNTAIPIRILLSAAATDYLQPLHTELGFVSAQHVFELLHDHT
jgi:hypothetical protein